MRKNIIITLIAIFGLVGYTANVMQMDQLQVESYTAIYVKGAGIMIPPLGTIMGYIGMFVVL